MKRHGRCSERPTRNKGPKNNGTRVANGRSRKQFTEQAKHTWRKGSGKKRRGIRRLPFGSAMYIYLYVSPCWISQTATRHGTGSRGTGPSRPVFPWTASKPRRAALFSTAPCAVRGPHAAGLIVVLDPAPPAPASRPPSRRGHGGSLSTCGRRGTRVRSSAQQPSPLLPSR